MRYVAIYSTFRGTGRPNIPRVVKESQYLDEKKECLWEHNNQYIGDGTEEECWEMLSKSVYVDEQNHTQWNWEYLNGTYPMVSTQV